jgi:Tol biopolymer transport system component
MRSIVRSCVLATCIIAGSSTIAIGQGPGRRPPPPNGAVPRVSPDGKHVLFMRAVEGQPAGFIMDADGSNPRQLSASMMVGSWLPDGKHLLGMQRTSRTDPGRLIIASVDGSDTREVPRGALDPGYAEVLADGKTILLASAKRDTAGHMVSLTWHTMNVDGSNARSLPMPEIAGRWLGLRPSRDGKRVAFVVADTSDPTTPFTSTTLYVMNIDGSGRRAVATVPDGLEQLSWSYDGKKIAMQRDDHTPRNRAQLPADYVPDAHIVVIDVATGAVKQITHPERRYLDETPDWSPDGHIYIQSDRDGRMEIYRMNADGSDQRRITK